MISLINNKFVKQVINLLIDIWMLPLYLVIKRSEISKDILLGLLLKKASERSNEYHTITSFPRNVNYLANKKFVHNNAQEIAIVIQGPLMSADDFTVNSVKLYRMLYPESKIIVSTWENEDKELCERCKISGAEIVLSVMPKNVGALNVNCQIISSQAGIERAAELGCKYVMKMRSDQRVTKQSALSLLKNSLQMYPVADDGKLSARIIFLGNLMNSYNALAFHISDFMMFGLTADVLKVFTIPADPRPFAFQEDVLRVYKRQYEFVWEKECCNKITIDEELQYNNFILKLMAPEQYILFEFTKKYLIDTSETDHDLIQLYWSVMQKYLIVLDSDALDFYWHKSYFKYIQPDVYKRGERYGKLTHSRWLDLYLTWIHESKVFQ